MTYTFTQPTEATLRDFVTVRNPDPESEYSRAAEAFAQGRLELSKRRLFTADERPLAALTRAPVPRPIYHLRAEPDLTEADALELLRFAATLGEAGGPATLNYTAGTAPDLSALALEQGWTLEAHVRGYRTDLSRRDDLEADPTARTFPVAHLLSGDFLAFYRPVWMHDVDTQELKPLLEEVRNFHDYNESGEGVYLFDGEQPVAAGVVSYGEPADMTLIGVSPEYRNKGWGRRLHRHLMWLAKNRTRVYVGSTDVRNRPMLRLFERNGCTFGSEVWQLAAPPEGAETPLRPDPPGSFP